MRIARKLTLLAMPALAAMALTAPSAFGQVFEPELHNQMPRLIVQQENHNALDANCPAIVPTPPVAVSPTVTSGGCRIHVASVGTAPYALHFSAGGVEWVVAECTVEFDIRIDSAGEGWFTHHEFTGPAGLCNRKACGQVTPPSSEGRATSYHISETESPPRERMVFLICTESINPGGDARHCELTVPLDQIGTHQYQFTMNDAPGHGSSFPLCEWTGTFRFETAAGNSGEAEARHNVEIRHT